MFSRSLLGLLALVGSVAAQTYTNCDPLNKTCPADPALGTEHTWQFNTTLDDKIWNVTNGEITTASNGTMFQIKEKLQSPTIESTFYIFFGIVESHVQMASGAGVVSSVVLESDDLDEIDWEWVGYNTSGVQSNYYGKGNTTSYDRAGYHYVPNAATEFHNYTTHWTHEKLEWWIDGELVRTLLYEDAVDGRNYPQTPSTVRYGIWPGGDPSESTGTIEWAGGEINYTAGPYTMIVEKVRVHDFHTGKSYEYTNHSGDWQSIKVVSGNSTAEVELTKAPAKTLAEKWADLSTGAKIGIYCGAAAFVVGSAGAFVLFFLNQRKKGRLEHALEDTKFSAERTEMQNFQTDWRQSEWKNNGYRPVQ
ncbi:hypothetical protein ASPZODRAFT_62923 [Penicilliopsis zonata CBS 506.65]|uniref:chitinase n=1 Tax=Penicilliopsis zonata CBS 506.65 TaxID=1073090 RepID=A0A1L9SNQ4_9EURO|nr:hypothetical protein ASPZODRAFT_62923 [Penicilliopsis zonata CBS 506.65]OJJ48677.1 hypothetical protein ASPZODRAFT_62923 [Penicilliopsis zonata CBS 506.65]